MKKANIALVVLIITLLLVGCGSNKPETVAKTFVKALSNANIDDAKEVSTESTKKTIDKLIAVCNESYYRKLTNETVKAYNIINNSKTTFDINKKLNTPHIEEEMKKIAKTYKKKYGDMRKLPLEEQVEVKKEIQKEFIEKIGNKYIKPLINNIFDVLKIKVDHPDQVKRILTKFIIIDAIGARSNFMNKWDLIYHIVKDGNFGNIKNATPACVAKYTDYDFVDSINLIEVKNISPDKCRVRLELIDKKDRSYKVSVPVEKIKGKWKVSDLSLDILFF